jgi:hypothetical protein
MRGKGSRSGDDSLEEYFGDDENVLEDRALSAFVIGREVEMAEKSSTA